MKHKRKTIAIRAGLAVLSVGLLSLSLLQNQQEAAPGLNRTPEELVLSKHAKCRMACREIDLDEVTAILKVGKVNKQKSRLQEDNYCQRRYALEGRTRDRQQVRIVFASCGETTTVITAIDLGADPDCYCP